MIRHEGKKRVLLAEDDEDIRSVFEMVLAERYEVTCAENAAQTLAMIQAAPPDVVLLDWTLPDATGEEVVNRLRRARPDLDSLPIVLVSGASSVSVLASRIQAIACPKPCDVDQLISAIERALFPGRSG